MITIFKNINDITAPLYRDITDALDRIREGTSQDLLERIRKEPEKKVRNELKKGLPAICFSGKFTRREDAGLVEHSGFVCLDFDGFESIEEMNSYKESLKNDDYVYSVFVSPSGDGIKVIVRIPKCDASTHKKYFNALEKHFNRNEFDTTSKNVSRVCYESYDPDIYINDFSFVWSEMFEEVIPVKPTKSDIPITDGNEILRRVMVWWTNNYGMGEGSRNHNLFILLKACCEFGVNKDDARQQALQFIEPDFTEKEILITLDSAYRDMSIFNTKSFEDRNKIDEIKKRISYGDSLNDVIGNTGVDEDVIRDIAESIQNDQFWNKSSKGVISIIPHKFRNFLTRNGYYKYYHAKAENFVFVKITNNLIDDTTEDRIKEFVLDYLEKIGDWSVYNFFAEKTKIFKEDFLNFIKTIEPKFIIDSKTDAYIYFRNCAVKVTPTEVTAIDYIDLDGIVWRKQIIERDFKSLATHECDYKRFVELVAGESKANVNSMHSTIGYLLHGFKPMSFAPAVIINDEKISDNPEGGTGKGIFVDALSKLKRTVIIDGKRFDISGQFAYQLVSADTQLLTFDDVVKNFDFERLFSLITQGITLEKKNKDAIKIPFEQSPKVIITTNYAIKGVGNSFERRKWELEFSQYFSRHRTPEDEFGKMLFTDWDSEEWLKFDNYMISCLQYYLNHGLVMSEFKNLESRKFIAETSFEFYEWCTASDIEIKTKLITTKIRSNCKDLYNNFIESYPDFTKYKLTERRFYTWLEKWGMFHFKSTPEFSRGATGKCIMFVRQEGVQLNF